MIGLDTNILIRYVTQDDAAQSARATLLIEGQLTEERPGFISVVTLLETVWVLGGVYGLAKLEIADLVERILQVSVFRVQHEQEAFMAVTALKSGAGSFADALIGELGAKAGCTETVTFDRGTKRLKTFRVLKGS